MQQFQRTELLIGHKALEKLKNSKVAIFGLGGVGGYALEALVRIGVGEIDIVDSDKVDITNINRQIIALNSTVGEYKTDVAFKRAKDINPNVKINKFQMFFTKETSNLFDFSKYDYVIDAIDTVSAKLELIEQTKKANIKVICAMGAGNKMDPTGFMVSDISKTSVCPLAKVIRQELKKRKIKKVKVVYSKELPKKPKGEIEEKFGRHAPASNSFVPPVVGLIIAGEVIKDLTEGLI